MAEPYRRPDSAYYWIDLLVDGQRVRRSTKRKTLKEARAVQNEILRQTLDQSQFAGMKEITIREALFEHYLPASVDKKSYPQLVRHCHTLCGDRKGTASLGGDTKFHTLNETMLVQYRSRRMAQGMSQQSIDHEMKCLSAAHTLIKKGYRVPPGLTFPMARVKGKARYLTPAEEAALLDELEPCRLRGKNGSRYFMDPLAPVVRQRVG